MQIQALKNMGLNISRARLSEDSKNKFFITKADSAEKVTKSAELEDIRQCIMHNMVDFHPETKDLIATSVGAGLAAPTPVLGAAPQVRPRPCSLPPHALIAAATAMLRTDASPMVDVPLKVQ